MEQVLNALQNVEEVAESILRDRQEMIEMDKKRNKNREALRQISNQFNDNKDSKLWLCFGNSFVKTRVDSAKSLINKDQIQVNKRIDELRNNLKAKVDDLRQLEGEEVLKGFDLKPLDKEEVNAIQTLL